VDMSGIRAVWSAIPSEFLLTEASCDARQSIVPHKSNSTASTRSSVRSTDESISFRHFVLAAHRLTVAHLSSANSQISFRESRWGTQRGYRSHGVGTRCGC
jgi:hypothetical protein